MLSGQGWPAVIPLDCVDKKHLPCSTASLVFGQRRQMQWVGMMTQSENYQSLSWEPVSRGKFKVLSGS